MKIKNLSLGVGVVAIVMLLGFVINNSSFVQAADTDITTTITVDSTLDTGDSNVGNGQCDDGSGNCTLRAAIQESNAEAGTQTIEFNIAPFDGNVKTFQPATSLPALEDTVIIDGYTQDTATPNNAVAPAALNGNLLIQIDGTNVPDDFGAWGLLFNPGSDGSEARGLVINRFPRTAIFLGEDNITLQGNYIGTSTDGLTDLGNLGAGITNANLSGHNAIIGGAQPEDRNLISGNEDAGAYPSTGWIIKGNYIGVKATGLAAMGNSTVGASGGLSIDDCTGVVVGGSETGAINVISGNLSHGVAPDNADDLIIQGNYIGVGRDGTTVIGNGAAGIVLTNSDNAQIGGYNSGEGNIVSNSGGDNLYLGSGNTNVTVQGNTMDSSIQSSISIAYGSGIVIGGVQAGAGNSISDSTQSGIYIYNEATDVTVQGNTVTNSTYSNITVDSVTNIVVGGTQTGAGNDVTDAVQNGITVNNGSTNVTIQGNTIDNSTQDNINVDAASAIVGGYQTGAGNTITNAGGFGISLLNSATNSTIQGNDVNNSASSNISVSASSGVVVGGTQTGAGNSLDTSGASGVSITTASDDVTVQANIIADETSDGIHIDGSTNINIGGSQNSYGNTVTNSGAGGISVVDSPSTDLLRNILTSNTNNGIYLSGSSNSVITGGSSTENTTNGIAIVTSDGVTITGINSSSNGSSGVNIDTLSSTSVTNSQLNNNGQDGLADSSGTDTVVRGNSLTGNTGAGITLSGTTDTIIGGTSIAQRNTISDNGGQANILVVGAPGANTGTTIQGNYIGVDSSGEIDAGYTQNIGITLSGNVSGSLVGGSSSGAGNVIAGNNGAGVVIAELNVGIVLTPSENTILGNKIFSSDTGSVVGVTVPGLGIDLLGIDVTGPPAIAR